MRGVALAGIIKNIYAIGLGIAGGLMWGDNQKGWLTGVAIREMANIIKLLGGEKETAYSVAGLGDLIATGYSPYSRNREVGNELVKTGTCCLESEGSRSLPIIASLLGQEKNTLPFFTALEEILIKNQNAKTIFENFITENH
jgi:glycerol-3-phosphate dehydrogenase (NAD(P)+)